jgi:hypothetical protein
VLDTDSEGDQIPGIAVSQHPSISQKPLDPFNQISPTQSNRPSSSRRPITTSALLNANM